MTRYAQPGVAALAVVASLFAAAPAFAIDDPGAIPTPEPPRPPSSSPGPNGPDDRDAPGGREDPRGPRASSAPDRFALDPSRGSMGSFFSEPSRDVGVSLMVSPLHVFLPLLLVEGELALDRKWTVDAVFGYGRPKIVDPSGSGAILHRSLFVGAFHGRYYILGNYRSGFPIVIGPKIMRVDTDQLLDLALFTGTNSIGIEAQLGFKKVIRGMFTAEFLGGADYVLYKPTPAHPSRPDVGDRPRRVEVTFSFNVGISF